MIARMRTVRQAVEYLRQGDKMTAIGETFLRRRIKDGSLPVVYAGKKALINLDTLDAFLCGQTFKPDKEEPDDYRPVRMRRIE